MLLTAQEPRTYEAPCGPERHDPHRVTVDAPGRISAFVFELECLFDTAALEVQTARDMARRLARRRGVDELWMEVLAVQLARKEGGLRTQAALDGLFPGEAPRAELTADVLASLEPSAEVSRSLETIHRRFKLAVVSRRPRLETMRILRALGLVETFDAGAFTDTSTEGGQPGQVCEHARRLLEEPADRCVLVGKLGSPMLAAADRVGMRSIALAARQDPDAVRILAFEGADLVVDSFELIEALAGGAADDDAEEDAA